MNINQIKGYEKIRPETKYVKISCCEFLGSWGGYKIFARPIVVSCWLPQFLQYISGSNPGDRNFHIFGNWARYESMEIVGLGRFAPSQEIKTTGASYNTANVTCYN